MVNNHGDRKSLSGATFPFPNGRILFLIGKGDPITTYDTWKPILQEGAGHLRFWHTAIPSGTKTKDDMTLGEDVQKRQGEVDDSCLKRCKQWVERFKMDPYHRYK